MVGQDHSNRAIVPESIKACAIEDWADESMRWWINKLAHDEEDRLYLCAVLLGDELVISEA